MELRNELEALDIYAGAEELIATSEQDPAGAGPEARAFARDIFAVIAKHTETLNPGERALVEYSGREVIQSLGAVYNERLETPDELPHRYLHRQINELRKNGFTLRQAQTFVASASN